MIPADVQLAGNRPHQPDVAHTVNPQTATPVARPTPSPRQRAILDAIRNHVTEYGYPPSIRDLAHAVGLYSPSSVAYQLKQIERAGWIRRDPQRPRAIVLVDDPDGQPCRHCGGSGRTTVGTRADALT